MDLVLCTRCRFRTRDGPGRGQSCKGAIGSGGESSEPQFAVPLIELTGSYPPQTEIPQLPTKTGVEMPVSSIHPPFTRSLFESSPPAWMTLPS